MTCSRPLYLHHMAFQGRWYPHLTWILWIGALLVTGGCVARLSGRAPAAGILYSAAALTFVVVIWETTRSPLSETFIVTAVLAFLATLVLVALTVIPDRPRESNSRTSPGP